MAKEGKRQTKSENVSLMSQSYTHAHRQAVGVQRWFRKHPSQYALPEPTWKRRVYPKEAVAWHGLQRPNIMEKKIHGSGRERQSERKGYMNFYIHVTRDHKSGYSPNTFVEASGHQLQQRMEIVSTGLRNSLLLSPLRLEEARGLLRFETCSGSVT